MILLFKENYDKSITKHGDLCVVPWKYLNCIEWAISGLYIGCPNHKGDPIPPDNIGPSQIAGVRCCSDDVCITPQPCSETTIDQAKAICATNGKRLCTVTELAENKCCGTGCGFDAKLTWYSGSTGKYLTQGLILLGAIGNRLDTKYFPLLPNFTSRFHIQLWSYNWESAK